LCSLSQCNCKNPNQGKGKNPQKGDPTKDGGYKTGPQPTPPIPNPPPAANPPPVGPFLKNISEGELRVMESISYSGGGSAKFLVDMLRDLQKDPS